MALVNMAEEIVKSKLDAMLATINCCKCEQCYNDMMAIALNYVKPQYVNTYAGQLLKRAENMVNQNAVDFDIAVLKAVEIVSRSPHHEGFVIK